MIKLVFTEPASIVHCALHGVRGLFGDRLLRIDVPLTMPSIRADPSQMERVLANLIENAIKYSPASTAVSIAARITEDAELEFTVDDDEGPVSPQGIANAYSNRSSGTWWRSDRKCRAMGSDLLSAGPSFSHTAAI